MSEILSQILAMKKIAGQRRISHTVFMGVGEPLDNYDNVIKAVANGKAVAREIDTFLVGCDRLRDVVHLEVIDNDGYKSRATANRAFLATSRVPSVT